MIRRVGIVGLGAAARTIHLPALRRLPALEVVGGHDVAPPEVHLAFPLFDSVEELLSAARPDLLIIATPPDSHVRLVRQALEAGCHVFCEKPLAEGLAEADALAPLAEAVGRQVVVNSEFPWIPVHAAAKARMSRPGFGRLQFAVFRQNFVVTEQSEAGWRGRDPRRTFKEFGTHVLDLARFFFEEEPSSIRALMPRPGGAGGPDLLNIVELAFSGDRMALILLNRLTKGRHSYLDVQLDGTEGAIETSLGGRLQATAGLNARTRRPFLDIAAARGGEARLYRGEGFERLARAPGDVFADGTARLLAEVVAAIDRGEEPPCSLRWSRTTLQLMLAAYESAGDGLPRSIAQ